MARQLLGTSETAECGCDPAPHREDDGTYSHWAGCPIADEQQAADAGLEPDAGLRDRIAAAIRAESSRVDDLALADAVMPVVTDRLRRNWGQMRDRVAELETEAQRLVDAAPPAPADRAAVLREGAASVESSDVTYDTEAATAALTNGGPFALIAYVQLAIGAHLRRLADEAAAGVQPPTTWSPDDPLTAQWAEATGKPTPLCPCGYVPVACDVDRGCTPPAAA
ncbi:hypothetical protein GT040_02760 [Streptomyces sp. SID2119]|nr:hypothetical protein [Streptomyces sp. SID2119]